MKALMKVVIELIGLFVDDGWLALAIIGVVAVTALVAALAPHDPVAAGVVLLVGCPGVLFGNVMRARHRGFAHPNR
ncbi:MAG: hypothetical protein HY067_03195 [Betaproteobacteria bacterium]|nr:hypothetical protein [Betaproteobacteria bacterium]